MRDCRRNLEQRRKLSEIARRKLEQVRLQQTYLSGPRKMETRIIAAISKGMEMENVAITLQRNDQYGEISACSVRLLKAGDRLRLGSLSTTFYVTQTSGVLCRLLHRTRHLIMAKFLNHVTEKTDTEYVDANLAQQVPTGVTRVRLNRIWTYDNLTLKVYKLPPQRFWHQIISQLGDHP